MVQSSRFQRGNFIVKPICKTVVASLFSVAITAVSTGQFAQAQGQPPQALIESCRQSVGTPIVRPCVQRGGSLESCRQLATPKVRACVQSAMQRGGGGGSPGMRGGPGGGGRQMAGGRSPAGPFVGKARGLIQGQQFAAAIRELDSAIKADPKFAFAWAWRGVAKQRMGNATEAMADFNQALALDPENTLALTSRGYAFYLAREFDKAMADLNKALDVDASVPQALAYRGIVLTETGDYDRALKDLTQALKLDPKLVPGLGGLGGLYSRQKQYEKAIVEFDKALKVMPTHFLTLNGRGFAYQSLGDNDRALADFNAALRSNPKLGRSYVNRGRIYIDKGDYASAISDSNEALKYFPKNVTAMLQRGRAYELSRDLKQAKDDFEAALVMAPGHPVATASLERIAAKAESREAGAAKGAGRVALVVGNSKYETFDTLANPERDARLVAEALSQSGFEKVQFVADGSRAAMAEALKTFAAEAKNADWAVVYFAGHGIELDGNNYLVPVDAKYEKDADIPNESVALDQVLNAVNSAAQMRLVILDACRENPFVTERKSGEATSTGRGLARIEPESGTLVAFATKHGHLASDGSGANSPFANALVQRIQTPGLEINRLFRLVHADVSTITGKKQEPFTYGQLSAQEFYFRMR